MNKKGFTLIEILAVIIVLGLVCSILIPKIYKTINGSNENAYKLSTQGLIDSFDNYVGDIVTDQYGFGSINLKYGEYKIKQISGIEGYDLVDDFVVNIKSNLDEYSYSLYNNKIIKEEFLVPNTGI